MGRVVTCMLLALLAGLAGAQAQEAQRLEVGPWTAEVRSMDLGNLSWQGEPIVRLAGVRGYLPGWQGTRFVPDAAEVSVEDGVATWHQAEPGNQETTTRLELTPERARFSLQTTIQAAGPTEFWAQIVPEAVAAGGQFFVWTDGDVLHTLPLDEPFEKIGSLTELRFERPERSVVIRCDGFELQDRRASGGGLFLVNVIGSSGGEPTEAARFIEIEVVPAPADAIAGRTHLLAQMAVETSPMPLRNPGFEEAEPQSGWSSNPLASADAAVAHSGERSARLDVPGQVEQRGQVYLTQMVPVQERHLYRASAWIRGEDVTAATHGGMSPVGATIIVEFADREGAWFASGGYGPSNYESFDWRRVSTDAVKAPEGAGYAIIFLALRGVGSAWFDDVALQEVQRNVVLLEPMPGASVHDNTPALSWHFQRETWAQVELARSPAFPDGETRLLPRVASPPVTITEPLEPGTWYWRVRVPEYDVASAAWSFEQTASLDEDTTAPEVARDHDWLATALAPLRVHYADNVGVAEVRLVVDGRDVSEQVEAGEREATWTPDHPWTDGLHVAEVTVEDAAGNAASETLFFTRSEGVPRIVWRQIGGLTIDGEPHFLLGMYGVAEEDMAEIAAAGFNFVHSYRWDGPGDTASALAYLDEAQRQGLRVFMGISRARLMAFDERFVAERVAALMGHRALLAWYLYDEPDLEHQYVSPMWLERYYRLIRALDPFHPVVVTCARDGAVPLYRDALDVHWTQVYGSTAFVASRLDRHREMLRADTPLSAILHCYDRAQTGELRGDLPPDPARFQPDGRTMRANAFMALAHNSSCLEWWWWGYGGGDRYFTVANAPAALASLQQTVADIHALEPALTSEGEIATSVIAPAEGVEVHLWEKRLADRVVTIAVNRDDQPCRAQWTPRWPPADGTARVRFEDRSVELAGGEMADDCEPLAVHVYEWPLAAEG